MRAAASFDESGVVLHELVGQAERGAVIAAGRVRESERQPGPRAGPLDDQPVQRVDRFLEVTEMVQLGGSPEAQRIIADVITRFFETVSN